MAGWERLVLAVATAGLLVAGGCAQEGSMAVRVAQARAQHEVRPTGYQPRVGADGRPEVALDVLVVNRGTHRLRSLTLLVVVVGSDGNDRASRRVTLNTSSLVPGVASQLSAVVGDLDVREGETLLVELENEVPEGERDQFPEFAEGVS